MQLRDRRFPAAWLPGLHLHVGTLHHLMLSPLERLFTAGKLLFM